LDYWFGRVGADNADAMDPAKENLNGGNASG
jgi:hypothetical protein